MTAVPRKEFWQGKRVFLTGHTGFKGSWLTFWLKILGAEVTGYSLDPSTEISLFDSLQIVQDCARDVRADIRDQETLSRELKAASPEIVFHLAAQPLVLESYRNPVDTFSTNVLGTVHLLEACRNLKGLKAIVNITTDKVYENKEWAWGYRENDRLGGKDPYSSSKACSELVTRAFRESYFADVPVVTCRAGNVIGGGDESPDRLLPDAFRAFRKGIPVIIRRPNSRRPWQHVLESLRGYLIAAEVASEPRDIPLSPSFNLGPADQDNWSVGEVMDSLCGLWGAGASWERSPTEEGPLESNLLKLDCSLARRELGWSPVITLKEALQLTVEWTQAAATDPRRLRALAVSQIQSRGLTL